ncbi:nucleoside 2-deoxyribosyltransferase domain-containing protein [Streptomyces sp. 769]|uniref:nucleoside 2-deoxyribosyltransferase domain-containing protein n=1 Tax=Streptomyces sp. 769 TaxID=1262452 RepID=UPI000581BFBB|nr:nucleoside 2-deoxyribosyltransferase domain-containing protein [Streptomyces sp. 769]AJC54984.1 hypothetical protein GZL_02393 [Streptomyces sp. 769]
MSRARYVEAPEEYTGPGPAIFLAGGIQECPDWQAEASAALADLDAVVLNPRRAAFPAHDPQAEEQQVAWESCHLHRATVVLFWFAASPSHQPIALYELGMMAAGAKPLAVGAEPGYARRNNVICQLQHARPALTVRTSLAETIADVRKVLA